MQSNPSDSTRMTALIIAVGSELLTPHKTDTNSLFLTEQLNEIGITVVQKMVVGDDAERLAMALRYGMSAARLVVITGGLGPTDDDVTRDVVASVLRRPPEIDSEIVEVIRARFASRGVVMPEVNRRQAEVPNGAEVIENPNGTAPGLWMVEVPATVVLLPGPPRELRPMFKQVVKERLYGVMGGRRVYRRIVRTTGQSESYVDERVKSLYRRWCTAPMPIETTILSSLGSIDLHLSLVSVSEVEAQATLDAAVYELRSELGLLVVSTDGRSLPTVVGDLLVERLATVSVAESCTGGLITTRLTDTPGSSQYVRGGWAVYSNEAKIDLLAVDPDLIRVHGAVSEQVAEAMAHGAQEKLDVDFALGVTGLAGPSGGTSEKPVGTVCIALVGRTGSLRVRRLVLPGDRERVRFQASQAALDLLRRALLRIAPS